VIWFLFLLFACQVFYYEDETTKDIQLAKVSSNYNNGIDASIDSSVKVNIYREGFPMGHGSGNLFKIGSRKFVITAAHVVDGFHQILLRETNGHLIPGEVIWANKHNDVAIIVPKNNKFEVTKAVSYVNNKKRQLIAEKLWHYAYPSKMTMQSHAWFGSSGSVVFDQRGRAVGVVHAITSETNPVTGLPTFVETLVIVNRVYDLSRKDILGILKDGEIGSRNSD
jgi:S1-C subfamily serine protease